MMRPFALLFSLLAASSVAAGEKTSPIPLRYRGLHQTKYLELKEVLGHPEQGTAMGHTAVLSPDGKLGLFAGGGATDIDGRTDESFLSLWEVETGRLLKEIRIPGKAITSLALDASGKKALTGLYGSEGKEKEKERAKETVELVCWSLDTGKALHTFPLKPAKERDLEIVITAAFSPDGKSALASCGGNDAPVRYLDLEKGAEIYTFRAGKEDHRAALALVFADNDRAFIGWGVDVHLWDLKKKNPVQAYKGHAEEVIYLGSSDGSQLATAGLDVSVRLWDVAKGTELAVYQKKDPVNSPLISVAFADKNQLLTVWTGNDATTGQPAPGTVALYDAVAKKETWARKADLHGLVPIAVQGKSAVLGGGGNPFCQWNIVKGVEEKVWGGHKSPVLSIAALKSGVISGGQEGHLKFWQGGIPRHVAAHADAVFAMRRDGETILTGSADKTVKLWSDKGELLKTFKGHEGNVTAVTFVPGKKWIASAGGDRVIRTWDLESGKQIAVISGHSEGINGLAASPDGKWLATASDDNTVRLWPVEEGKLTKEDVVILEGHKRQATSVAFTPDGKHLVSGSQDKTIRIWDVEKQSSKKVLEGHQNWVSQLLVWNSKVVSVADDFRVILWDLEKGKLADVIDLTPYGDCPRCVALTADGNGLLVGTSGWVVMRFELLKK